jgi:hypothetical protein
VSPMQPPATPKDRAPSRTDSERTPRGPTRDARSDGWGVSPALVIASTSLIGTLLAMGAAAAAPTATATSASHPCFGTLTAVMPATIVAHAPTTVHLKLTPAPGVRAACVNGLHFVYLGLPPGILPSHTHVLSGVPVLPGSYPVHVLASGSGAPMTTTFVMTVR